MNRRTGDNRNIDQFAMFDRPSLRQTSHSSGPSIEPRVHNQNALDPAVVQSLALPLMVRVGSFGLAGVEGFSRRGTCCNHAVRQRWQIHITGTGRRLAMPLGAVEIALAELVSMT